MPFMIKFFKTLDTENTELALHGHDNHDHAEESDKLENINFKYNFIHPNFIKE